MRFQRERRQLKIRRRENEVRCLHISEKNSAQAGVSGKKQGFL